MVDHKILGSGGRTFLVTDQGGCRGILTLNEVTSIPRDRWAATAVSEAMIPEEHMVTVHPDTELLDALRDMDSANVAQVPVIENETVSGILSREQNSALCQVTG